MVWVICKLVLTKLGLLNNLVLLISYVIALFLNVSKEILCIILYRNRKNKMKINLIFYCAFSFSLSNLI